jgi:CDP-glucose 4,6-dehydratase
MGIRSSALEDLARLNRMHAKELVSAYRGKRVLVTGHTGFKGSWLVSWLHDLGAEVTGYALPPDTKPALFEVLGLSNACRSHDGDIRDLDKIRTLIQSVAPHYLFHLAAQPLVRRSHAEPLETFDVNVRGTATVLEALRRSALPCVVVVVSSDKCYENCEWVHGYREDDKLGGHDPYAASKAATEIVAISYRRSFFPPSAIERHGVALATARAGNVIGGGDWATDRIIPDAMRALSQGRPIRVRNPRSIRPWQHVLEPLSGYLTLGSKLTTGTPEERALFCDAWNFGPLALSNRPVADLVEHVVAQWGEGAWIDESDPTAPHESSLLALSIDKAIARLGWLPRWSFANGVEKAVSWYRAYYGAGGAEAARATTMEQLRNYGATMTHEAAEG